MNFHGKEYEKALKKIADYLGCYSWEVEEAFGVNPPPDGYSREAIRERRETKAHLERAQNGIRAAVKSLENLPIDLKRNMAAAPGYITVRQIETFGELIGRWIELDHEFGDDLRGGRNPDAELIAFNIAELFSILGKRITFGQSHDGEPSTEYGRAVEFALKSLAVEAHWKSPAQKAFKYLNRQ